MKLEDAHLFESFSTRLVWSSQ